MTHTGTRERERCFECYVERPTRQMVERTVHWAPGHYTVVSVCPYHVKEAGR